MTVTTVDVDPAKNAFTVHCADQNGKTTLVKPKASRVALPELIANLPPHVIGMETYSGTHYRARMFRQHGHESRLMTAKFVLPYYMAGKSGKNDTADAQAVCETVRCPCMRSMPVKDEGRQTMQCLYRTKQGFIEEKTAIYSRLRDLVSEFSIIAPQSADALRHIVPEQEDSLSLQVQQCVDDLPEHINRIGDNIAEHGRIPPRMVKTDHRSQRLMELKRINPTTTCALVADISNVHDFESERRLAV